MRDDADEAAFSDEPTGIEGSDLATDAEVTCPYCGETVTLALDPHGGMAQEYVEDCPVCCRPWQVQVSYDDEGTVEVSVDATE